MGKLNINNDLVKTLIKAGKISIVSLGITAIASSFTGCVNKENIKSQNGDNKSVSETTEEHEAPTVFKIGDREYEVTNDEISYEVVEGDNLWSIGQDLHLHEDEIMNYNNLDSDLIHIGDKLTVPMDVFKDISKTTGLKVSEENGDINWEVVRYFTDFALLTAADFSQDEYTVTEDEKEFYKEYYGEDTENYRRAVDTECIDSNIKKNIKGCEENNIDYGIFVYGGMSVQDFQLGIQTGKEDADKIINLISQSNIKYPVILEIPDTTFGNMNSAMGDSQHFSDEYTAAAKRSLCQEYCISFLNEIKKAGYHPVISTTKEVYDWSINTNDELRKFDKMIIPTFGFWNSEDDYNNLINELNCNLTVEGRRTFLGIKRMQSYCKVYVDNTSDGMKTYIEKEKDKKQNKIVYIIIGGIAFFVVVGGLKRKKGTKLILEDNQNLNKDGESFKKKRKKK